MIIPSYFENLIGAPEQRKRNYHMVHDRAFHTFLIDTPRPDFTFFPALQFFSEKLGTCHHDVAGSSYFQSRLDSSQ